MCENILAVLLMRAVTIISSQLDRVSDLILPVRSRHSFLQPGHVHMLDSPWKIREVLMNEKSDFSQSCLTRILSDSSKVSSFLLFFHRKNKNKKWILLNEFYQCNPSIIGISLSPRFTFFSKQYVKS